LPQRQPAYARLLLAERWRVWRHLGRIARSDAAWLCHSRANIATFCRRICRSGGFVCASQPPGRAYSSALLRVLAGLWKKGGAAYSACIALFLLCLDILGDFVSGGTVGTLTGEPARACEAPIAPMPARRFFLSYWRRISAFERHAFPSISSYKNITNGRTRQARFRATPYRRGSARVACVLARRTCAQWRSWHCGAPRDDAPGKRRGVAAGAEPSPT